MNDNESQIASNANIELYKKNKTDDYLDDAPHLKHRSVNKIYNSTVLEAFKEARKNSKTPVVLDLGAGEGEATISFLKLGCKVIAVDISLPQIESLKIKCEEYNDMLEVKCQDINDFFINNSTDYDIIVFNSFLHHLPDYLDIIERSLSLIKGSGVFFCFQDPIRYDTLNFFTNKFSIIAYFSWRIRKGDVIGGFKRRIRRYRGIYYDDSVHDNAEYHATRNGVDQNAISDLLYRYSFETKVVKYFSTQSSAFQYFGEKFKLENTFGIVARKKMKDE